MVPDAGELLFSVIFSYMGALEFFFIARNLYHWGFKHHKRMVDLSDDANSLNELQEQIKAAINEAKEKEMYGLNAMKDGVLYKDGFRVSPGTDISKNDRQVIGSSRNSLEKKIDSKSVSKSHELATNKSSIKSKKQNERSKSDVAPGEQQQEVIEEPFVKKQVRYEENENTAADNKRTNLTQSIKTQFGQTDVDKYSSKSEATAIEKPELSTTKSDDSSSNEPASTHRSGFSNQESSSLETTMSVPEMHFDEYNRPEPDGQDVNEPQYSDDYLRSLDGIKYRPLVRDDGTGRRRAFKKRRSSGDSTSSRESRASREEELKMFTSLEEEESEAIKRGDTDYAPIRYSSDSNLKIDRHSRRHKRSPVKGSKDSEESRSSLEMLDEEAGNPWGDVKPEHYKDMEFWKREKAISIEEEENESNSTEQQQVTQKSTSPSSARNVPKMSSFEDATRSEHESVIESFSRNRSHVETTDNTRGGNAKNVSTHEVDQKASSPSPASNLEASAILNNDQKSFETDENVVHDQQTDELMQKISSKLRRSPRQDDMENYEERFIEEERRASRTPSPRTVESETDRIPGDKHEKEAETSNWHLEDNETIETFSDRKTPRIEIDYAPDIENPETQSFEDDSEEENEGETTTVLEGISDFYDFNASINPSRSPSRSSSRARSEPPSPSRSHSIISENFYERDRSRETSPFPERAGISENLDERRMSRETSPFPERPGISENLDERRMSRETSPFPARSGISENFDERRISRETSPFPERSGISENFDERRMSRETSPFPERSGSVSVRGIPGVSDWYDYNVMLNRRAYGIKVENFRIVHESSTDFIISRLKTTNNIERRNEYEPKTVERSSPDTVGGKAKSKERSSTPELDSEHIRTSIPGELNLSTNDEKRESFKATEAILETPEAISENDIPETCGINQTEEPSTPQFPRSFSAEWKDTERLKEKFKREFKRSKYMGESIDFTDEFDELREQTKHFRRSRSKSRTPTEQDIENIQIGKISTRRKLQDKILAQITKTTLDYQDFAKDINREFLDHERRGSDSALLQKSQILIQIQDNELRNGEYDDEDDLEAEEYHHFRRFSINQEPQVEEYPADDYLYEYIQQLALTQDVKILDVDEIQSEDVLVTEEIMQIQSIADDIVVKSFDHIVADDQEDSGSDDERQTVVEVDDEIDEDICDFEKSDDQFNEQSECEEAEREADRYVNHSAGDWREEGAVGGVTEWHNTNINGAKVANIEDMYDDALRYIEEEDRMEKDYENIIEAMNNEDQNRNGVSNDLSDNISIKTEDILEEILNEDEEKYRRLSPRQNTKYYLKNSSRNLIEKEKQNGDVEYYISSSTVVHRNTASTRLRSRYGLPPATPYRNFDYDLENAEIDLNYKPKKEYNWRKNFKIDDDDDRDSSRSTSRKFSPNAEENQHHEENGNENAKEYLDLRKYSLGGESITLYSRSIESEERQLEIENLEQFENVEHSEMNHTFQENGESFQNEMDSNYAEQNEKITEDKKNEDIILETEQSDVVSKRKKIKKKSRKGSKASLGDDDLNSLNAMDLTKADDDQTTSVSKKKIKKKKKVKIDVVSEDSPPNIKSPEPEEKTKPLELKSPEPSHNFNSNLFKPSKSSKSPESVTVKTESVSTVENSATAIPARISPNKENIPVAKAVSPQLEIANTVKTSSPNRVSKSPDPTKTNKEPVTGASGTQKPKPPLERKDSSGAYELIKDSSMYPWF